jgi:hypothetical protein
MQRRRRRHRGGLEAGGEEHHFLFGAPGQLERLRDRVDDVDRAAFGLRVGERFDGAGDAQHVAVGGDAHALARQRHAFVDLGHVGDAHRAAGAHDDVERAREDGAQAEAGDRLLVAPADVHDGGGADLPRQLVERVGELPGARRVAELQRRQIGLYVTHLFSPPPSRL